MASWQQPVYCFQTRSCSQSEDRLSIRLALTRIAFPSVVVLAGRAAYTMGVRRREIIRGSVGITMEFPVASKRFTKLQGQYLAYIHSYSRLHGVPPAESDLQSFFAVTPPSVHDMIVRLHTAGLIFRVPGEARSLRVRLPENEIPSLEPRGSGIRRR